MQTATESGTSIVSKDQQSLDDFLLDIDEDLPDDDPDPLMSVTDPVDSDADSPISQTGEKLPNPQNQVKRVTFANTVQDVGPPEDSKESAECTYTRDSRSV